MLIESIGKRRYAFGLDWIIQAGKPADVLTKANVMPSDEPVFAVTIGVAAKEPRRRKKKDDASVAAPVETTSAIGYVSSIDSMRGIVPAAAALLGEGDGLYVAQLSTGEWWCVGIQHKLVIAYSDKVGSLEEVSTHVIQLRQGLGLDVFTATRADELPEAKPFDLDDALRRGSKAPGLRRVSTGSAPIVPWVLAGVVLALGVIGWRLMFPPTPKLTPEQQRELAKQQYIQGVQGVVGNMPVGGGWLVVAYDQVRRELPPFTAGWSLEAVDCTASPAQSCKGSYVVAPNQPFALSPLNARFGASAVIIGQDGRSATVTLPIAVKTQVIDELLLRSVRPATMPLLDWVGAVPLGMGGAKVDGQLLVRHLDQEFGASMAGMPPLYFESLRIKGDSFLDDLTLRPVLLQGSRGGFVPVTAHWSYGHNQVPAGWNITWERIHG